MYYRVEVKQNSKSQIQIFSRKSKNKIGATLKSVYKSLHGCKKLQNSLRNDKFKATRHNFLRVNEANTIVSNRKYEESNMSDVTLLETIHCHTCCTFMLTFP